MSDKPNIHQKKIKLLFVIESLVLAGSEKSLIALLSNLDPELYEIDLQLFKYGDQLEKAVPSYVRLLPELDYHQFTAQPLGKNFKDLFFSSRKLSFLRVKLMYSFLLRLKSRTHHEIAKLYWKISRNIYDKSDLNYDVAVAYAQGLPTFYVIDKVAAKAKIAWVNANVDFEGSNKVFQEKYYSKLDAIVAVSEGTKDHQTAIFPHLSNKYIVIDDIIDYNRMVSLSQVYQPKMVKDTFNILTVSRLVDGMKGMDIMMEVCRLLHDKGVRFHWYLLGEGPFRPEMEQYFKDRNLTQYISFIGTTDNPYPYYLQADLYVQTSRNESYGMSIAEARLLNLPVVTTDFATVAKQMINGKNGLVTEMTPDAVADGIIKMITDNVLYQDIRNYLTAAEKVNLTSVDKFNALIYKLVT